MNILIEHLNVWGDLASRFAGAMLWQSSLLLGLFFCLDRLLQRKVRAAIRYGLWLVVLVKLLLPPSLALPTGLGWWLRPAPAPSASLNAHVTVTYGPSTTPAEISPGQPALEPQPRRLSLAACVLLTWAVVGLTLLVWMGKRWRNAVKDLREVSEWPPWLDGLLSEAQQAVGLRRPVRLRLLDQSVSPAVCGLIHPVILLPWALVHRLDRAQLRAVLLHELIHVRRRDVWVNCAQALLQVLYWWHPLVWLANARIRRVREEAVDDAVMALLRDEAETYPPTLLEVAKLGLLRPLASLGLVNILEAQSGLRQRIERLLDFHPPRHAGLTLGAALWVMFFGAVALPMGEKPPKTTLLAATAPTETQRLNQPIAQPGAPRAPADVSGKLLTRILHFDSTRFQSALRSSLGRTDSEQADVQQLVREFFTRRGLDLRPPEGIFFNAQKGFLIVRATEKEIDAIETALIQGLTTIIQPTQVSISGKLVEVPTGSTADIFRKLGLETNGTNAAAILNPIEFDAILKQINAISEADVLSEMNVLTLSGRQAQIQCVDTQIIVTNIDPRALTSPGISPDDANGGVPYLTTTLHCGPVLDVLPGLISDGWQIELDTTATVTEFLGYGHPAKPVPVYIGNKKRTAVLPLPRIRVRSASNSASLWDGQTLVLLGSASEATNEVKDEAPLLGNLPRSHNSAASKRGPKNVKSKRLLVFLTVTLLDPAGNRLHTDEQVDQRRAANAK